jgi:peptidylprolyl isomerase
VQGRPLLAFLLSAGASVGADPQATPAAPTFAEVLASTSASDWRPLDAESTLYLDLPSGRVVIELAPSFAPRHVANVKALAREGYYDGLAIIRSQDDYVVQWGDPDAGDAAKRRPIRQGRLTLPAEFTREAGADLRFTRLPDVDGYAPEVGFSDGFPAARDPSAGRAWLAHCYAMVGAGRDDEADSGGGAELYVVTGNAPRHLDRNVTLLGRVVEGIERLSTLPRGSGPMGVYETAAERVPLRAVRVAADLPAGERTALEVLRTDTASFERLVESRRNRRETWFKQPAGHVSLCNVPIPVRRAPSATR